jgi:predicted  nucleic acid-binding Zn-ribbon protein
MTFKDRLRQLVDIQKVDAEAYRLRYIIGEEKQQAYDRLAADLSAKRASLDAADAALKKVNVEKKDLELEIRSKQDAIGKANADLMRLRSNDEYHAKQTEIERAKQAVSDAEDKEIALFDVIAAAEKSLAQEKASYVAYESAHKKEKSALDAQVETLKDELARLDAKRETLFREMDGKYKDEYQRLVTARRGSAVVPYENGSCGGCHMSLPIWYAEKIKAYDDIVRCADCARILYLVEEL